MADEQVQQTTLRDTLESMFEAAEHGTLEVDRPRDESGKFVKQEESHRRARAPIDEMVVEGEKGFYKDPKTGRVTDAPKEQVQTPSQVPQRPTTWKKDYLPIWDKLASGQAITPEEAKKLADYTTQRENEYKTGVSTYKTEAMQAKELQEAITPFLPELQAHGMKPADWIKELGAANYVLIKGTPQQKLQMFQNLAQRYGVPLAALQQQPNQGAVQLLQIIGDLKNQIGSMNAWKQQIESKVVEGETRKLQSEVETFAANAEKHPHFEAVREQMARLLETGLAPDLESAYEQAIYLVPEVRQQLLTAAQQPKPGQVAAQARAKAVSPKSSTPSGQAKTGEAKDRRSVIAEQVEAALGGRV